MATLKELVDEHGFGVKFETVTDKAHKLTFTPYYCLGSLMYGPSNTSPSDKYNSQYEGWQLYVEPKKKFKRYLHFGEVVTQRFDNDNASVEEKFYFCEHEEITKDTLLCDGKPVYIEVEE